MESMATIAEKAGMDKDTYKRASEYLDNMENENILLKKQNKELKKLVRLLKKKIAIKM